MYPKPHKGMSKRIKKTGTGKLMRRRIGKRKLMSTKSAKRRRHLRGWTGIPDAEVRRIERQFGKVSSRL